MRVKAPRSAQVLVTGKRFVESIFPGANHTKIRFQFGCDIGKLLSFNVVMVRLSIYDREVSIETKPLSVTIEGDSLVSAAQEDSREKERVSKVRESFRIYQSNVDVTSFLQNDGAKSIIRKPEITYEAVSTFDSKIFQSESKVSPTSATIFERKLDSREMRRLIRGGIDPATVRAKFPIENPGDFSKSQTRLKKLPKGYANKIIASGVKSKSEVYARLVGSPSSYKKGKYSSRYNEIYADVILPNSALLSLNSLYVYLEALNPSGISIDFLNREVDLVDIASDIVRSRRQEESITLSRPIPPARSEFYTEYRKINRNEEITTLNAFGDPIIRRRFNMTSFSGSITKRKSIQRGKSEEGFDIIPFYPERNGENLELKVPNVPENIIAISLQRRRPLYKEGFSPLGSEVYLVNEGSSASFVDSKLVDDTHYEYRLRFVDNRSNVRYSCNFVQYHYVSSNLSDRISATVSSVDPTPATDLGSEVPRLAFALATEVRDKGVESVKQLLSTLGVSEEVISGTLKNPENYSKFIAYEVIRYNLRTGDTDSFGVFSDPTFVDDSALSTTTKTSVTPLNFFDRYRYVIRFGMRSPSSLAPTQVNSNTDPLSGISYTYKAYKFKSRRLPTNLPSNAEMTKLLRGDAVPNLDMIDIGIEVAVDFAPDKYQPRIYDLSLRKSYVKSNFLSWRVDGAINIIDHFQVYALADGVEVLIGCSHPFSKSGLHTFEDFELYDRVGTITYRVVPVLTNFTSSPGEAKVSVTRKSNLPDFLQERDAS